MAGNRSIGSIRGTIDIDYNGAGILRAERDIDKVKKTSGGAGDQIQGIGNAAGVAGAVIAGGFAVAAGAAISFDKRMSAVKAVSGASAQEMDRLRAKALQLGADTKFSASESALAMEELVKAGLQVDDVLNGAADATIALAAAGEIALPEAASIASNAMNQFSLKAQDMPRIADLIAGAANASAIDVREFGFSLAQAGAVANLAGLSFDDTAVAIAEMGNAGIKGSDAGTSLKTFLSNLIPTTDKAKGLFEEMGLILPNVTNMMKTLQANGVKPLSRDSGQLQTQMEQLAARMSGTKVGSAAAQKEYLKLAAATGSMQNQFFTAEGKVKSLAEIQEILKTSTAGMTAEQKQMALQTLFGSDAIRAAAVLSKEGADGFNKMAASMGKVSAADVAKTRLDNTAGMIEALKGSAETFAIQMGSLVIPALNKLIKGLTVVLNWFSGLGSTAKGWIAGLLGVTAGLLLTGAAVIKLVSFFSALKAAIVTLRALAIWTKVMAVATKVWAGVQWLLNAAMAANPVGLIIIAVLVLIGVIVLLWKRSETFRNIVLAVWGAIKTAAQAVAAWFMGTLVPIFKAVWDGIVAAFHWAWGIIKAVFNLIAGYARFWFGIMRAIFAFFAPLFQAVFGLIIAIVQTAWSIITAIFEVAATLIMAAVRPVWNAIVGIIRAVLTILTAVIRTVWGWITSYVTAAVIVLRRVITTVWNAIKAATDAVWPPIRDTVVGVWRAIMRVVLPIVQKVWSYIQAAWNGIKSGASVAWNAFRVTISTVWDAVLRIIRAAIDRVIRAVDNIKQMLSKVRGFFNDLRNAAKGGTDSLIAFVAAIPGRILRSLGSLGSSLWQKGKDLIQGFINGIRSMASAVGQAILGILPDPLKKFAKTLGLASPSKLFQKWGSWTFEGFVDGLLSQYDAVKNMMSTFSNLVTFNNGASTFAGAATAPRMSSAPASPTPGPGAGLSIVQNVTTPPNATAAQVATALGQRINMALATGTLPLGVNA